MTELSTVFAQFGLPSLLTFFFFGWFFGRYLPRQNAITERRFDELNRSYSEALRAQERAHLESLKSHERLIANQNELYENSIQQLITGYAELRNGYIELKSIMEGVRRHFDVPEEYGTKRKTLSRKPV